MAALQIQTPAGRAAGMRGGARWWGGRGFYVEPGAALQAQPGPDALMLAPWGRLRGQRAGGPRYASQQLPLIHS